jgi:uncharacterized protein (DUF924 family)
MTDQAREVREFWFGRLPLSARALAARMRFWFPDDAPSELTRQLDAAIQARFEPLMQQAARGEFDAWADSPRRRLSLILLLDQFPRNVYRGTARAFASDERALALALSGIQSGAEGALDVVERIFFYMPLQHAESLEVQDESVAAYRRLLNEAPDPLRGEIAGVLHYAVQHREVIERFGRFPTRNVTLGRETTREEREYLTTAGRRS